MFPPLVRLLHERIFSRRAVVNRYTDEVMRIILGLLPVALILVSCGNKEAAPLSSGPHARVLLRDGTQLSGQVVASSPRQVVVAGDDNATRTLDMKQVKSIEYDEAQVTESPEHRPDTGMARKPERERVASNIPDAVHENHTHPSESMIQTRTYVLPAGTKLDIRTEETIDSGKAIEGQTYAAEVAKSVSDANGDLVIPKGANAQIVIKSAAKGGRFRGASDLVLDLKWVSIEGRQYALDTTDMVEKGRQGVGANKRTAEFGGTGAAIGAIIGAIAGGGKGAAIGAGAGAGAGVLSQVITKGGSIKVPAESVLTFELEKALRVVAAQ